MQGQMFQSGIKRLNECFNNFYNPQRADILWKEFGSFQDESWNHLVDEVIRKCKSAPTIEELSGFASDLRQRLYQRQKEQFKNDAKDFWSGRLMPDEIKMRIQIIKDRINGKVDDKNWKDFLIMLKNNADREEGLIRN